MLSRDSSTLAIRGSTATEAWVDIYTRAAPSGGASSWSGQARLRPLATASTAGAAANNTGEGFGTALAFSRDGSTLAVGAPEDRSRGIGVGAAPADRGSVPTGAVTVYVRSGTAWRAQTFIKPGSADAAAGFGAAVALSEDGTWLAVGVPRESNDTRSINGTGCTTCRPESGAVYVYQRDAQGQWRFNAYIKAANADAGDHFGHALAISNDGRVLVVGAPFEDSAGVGIGDRPNDNSSTDQGAAYVFRRRTDGSWYQHQYLKQQGSTAGSNWFGFSVGMTPDARELAIGAPHTGGATRAGQFAPGEERCDCVGAVNIYKSGPDSNFIGVELGDFRWVYYLTGEASGDRFGWRVDIKPGALAVAAPGADGGERGLEGRRSDVPAVINAGAVTTYAEQSKDLWRPDLYIKSPTPRVNALFGAAGLTFSTVLAAGDIDLAAQRFSAQLYDFTPR